MKKIVLVVVSLIVLGTGLYYLDLYRQQEKGQLQSFAMWKIFVPQSRLFKVLLPQTPHYAKDYIAIPNSEKKRRYDMYASEKVDGTVFLISILTYPKEVDMSLPHDILRQNIEEIMQSRQGNRLVKIMQGNSENRQSSDFSFENQEFHVEGKAIIDDHTIYMLTYTTRKENFDPEEYQYFIDSFQVLPKSSVVSQ